jgi:hypothetical protein
MNMLKAYPLMLEVLGLLRPVLVQIERPWGKSAAAAPASRESTRLVRTSG